MSNPIALVIVAEAPSLLQPLRPEHTAGASSSSKRKGQVELFDERYRWRRENPQEDFDFLELVIASDYTIGRVMKFRVRRVSPRSFFGRGQAEQIREAVRVLAPVRVVTNAPLSAVHQRNLGEDWNVEILTRADLIFSIFETNATTSEGRLQVELARLNYELPRVVGVGKELSRTGGDRGTRGGGGEPITTLTKDRIRKRIRRLGGELLKLKRVRELRRKQRLRAGVFTVSLIGYTNSGKSSLLNALTGSEEEVAERYFTTLDPAARSFYLGEGANVVVSDTVGFLDDLPPELMTAFGATMEEVAESDLLLHVVDASRDNVEFRIESGERILREYGLSAVPRVVVFNKTDLLDDFAPLEALRERYPDSVAVSAHTGDQLAQLRELIRQSIVSRVA